MNKMLLISLGILIGLTSLAQSKAEQNNNKERVVQHLNDLNYLGLSFHGAYNDGSLVTQVNLRYGHFIRNKFAAGVVVGMENNASWNKSYSNGVFTRVYMTDARLSPVIDVCSKLEFWEHYYLGHENHSEGMSFNQTIGAGLSFKGKKAKSFGVELIPVLSYTQVLRTYPLVPAGTESKTSTAFRLEGRLAYYF